MKVIVAGATGLAGGAVVRQCIEDERIDSVILLTRKPLGDEIDGNPKTEIVMHQDFSTYPDEIMHKLEGAEACIWCIGGRVDQFGGDKELCRRVGVDFTLAAAQAMRKHLAPKMPAGQTFRFVFCSGKFAEWDQDKSLLFLGDTRRFKGQVEKGLSELADPEAKFDTWMLRPSGILKPDASAWNRLVGKLYYAVDAMQLAKALVRVALEGWEDKIIENDVLLKM